MSDLCITHGCIVFGGHKFPFVRHFSFERASLYTAAFATSRGYFFASIRFRSHNDSAFD